MTDIHAHAAAMRAALPDILATAERVVNIDSGTYHAAGVNAVIDVWAGLLAGIGFTIDRAKLPGFGDQLTARLAPGGNGRRLLILGHADTVWPAGTVAEWAFARRDGLLTGPGIGDMKTNVTMAILALRHLAARGGLRGLGAITFLVVPDEEIGSPQSRGWIEEHARAADLCLTLEPARPGHGVVVGRGATGAVYVTAEGVTAHCGAAREQGASAVAALAPLVPRLEALGAPERGLSATVGIFRGGAARQVVPGHAEIHLDLRAPDEAGEAALLREVAAILDAPASDPRVRIAWRGGFARPAFPTLPGTEALYERAAGFAAALGIPCFPVVSRGGSDGSFAARLGVPTLDGLGPVTHDVCSRREAVEIDSIAPRAAVLAGLMEAG